MGNTKGCITVDQYKKAEQFIAGELTAKGHDILSYNYKYMPYGEIDIISLYKGVLFFTEVKARQDTFEADDFIHLFTWSKRQRVLKTAQRYMYLQKQTHREFKVLGAMVLWNRNYEILDYSIFSWC